MTEAGEWLDPSFEPGLVSVIIPTHDRARLLPEAVRSVFEQDHRPLEVVVVDDGSTDDTAEVLERLAAEAPHGAALRWLRQPQRGAPAARNAGLRACRGEFILHLDSDDVLLPGKLGQSVRVMFDRAEVDLVCSAALLGDGQQVLQPPSVDLDPSPATVALRNLQTSMPLFRRRVLVAAGPWRETLACSQEWEFHTRALTHVRAAVNLFDPLYRLRFMAADRISHRRGLPSAIHARLEAREAVAGTVLAHGHRSREVIEHLANGCLIDAKKALIHDAPATATRALRAHARLAGGQHALSSFVKIWPLVPTRVRRAIVLTYLWVRGHDRHLVRW